MSRPRKTKKQKLITEKRRENEGFRLKEEWLKVGERAQTVSKQIKVDNRYFRADLTKTFVLTMLVLALELALWHYLSRH